MTVLKFAAQAKCVVVTVHAARTANLADAPPARTSSFCRAAASKLPVVDNFPTMMKNADLHAECIAQSFTKCCRLAKTEGLPCSKVPQTFLHIQQIMSFVRLVLSHHHAVYRSVVTALRDTIWFDRKKRPPVHAHRIGKPCAQPVACQCC